MTGDAEARADLLERIRARRAGIATFVGDLETRASRLTNLSIICSAVGTALTAGPALGGTRFTDMSADVLDLRSSIDSRGQHGEGDTRSRA